MSICTRCGAEFGCAMVDGDSAPCWCMALPLAVKVPQDAASCWCPACLRAQIAAHSLHAAGQDAGLDAGPDLDADPPP